ncbi:permease [Gemmatirosa kalamazoonensis]|uniref:Permease n=1 Tax=Gemmatirosa kalamazoonensis TaxID=861299 RepID=W0R9T5_9BACT|nr:ABC transporter permease [Gemmatirosa kalamazoonensis]AHG87869.1 permease [Gemmatirosa kalamazoonensis]
MPNDSPRRLFRLPWSPRQIDDDVETEVAFHLDARVRELTAAGASADAARDQAAREFGDVRAARAELRAIDRARVRRVRLGDWWDGLRQDLRFAARSLRRRPLFLASAVLTLALGIGANAAIFSVVDGVLLKPLPYAAPGRLVRVWPTGKVPLGIYDLLVAQSRSYRGLAGAETGREVSVTDEGEPARLVVSLVTPNAFDVLGVRPALGRAFAPDARDPGRGHAVVLSDALWRTRYGSDPRVVGRTIRLDGVAHTVLGVMPRDFRFPNGDVQLWSVPTATRASPDYWWGTYLALVGRLAPGVTPAQARAEANVLLDRARSAFPVRMPDGWGHDVDVVPLRDAVVGSARPTLLVLLGAVSLVLLVACVNVATLYAERAAGRTREIAVRASLGAGRRRIARQLLTESVLVASLGAAAGFALAALAVRGLVALLPPGVPRVEEIGIDLRVLGVTAALATLSGLAFGLLPALRASRQDAQAALRGGASGHAAAASAPRALVVAQVALAVVLVSSAGLLMKSFWRLRQVELGFRTERVLTATVPNPIVASDTLARVRAFYDAALERVRAVPGVRAAAFANGLPFGGGAYFTAMAVEDHPTPPGVEPPLPVVTWSTGDYLQALGIPLLRGRALAPTDREGTPRVGLVDEEAARRFWPGEDPIGRRVRYVWDPTSWITIVGVVGTVRRDSLSAAAAPSLYVPMRQAIARPMRLVVRAQASTDPATLARALRAAVASVDPSVPVGEVTTLDDVVSDSAARPRFTMTLLAAFALVAVLLGAVGIYGVVAAGVARRRREIGVRLALGASAGRVRGMVLREGGTLAAAGVVAGLVGALAAGRLLRGLLFGVAPADPLVLLAVPVVLAVVALAATVIPARRAARVEPLVVMRDA